MGSRQSSSLSDTPHHISKKLKIQTSINDSNIRTSQKEAVFAPGFDAISVATEVDALEDVVIPCTQEDFQENTTGYLLHNTERTKKSCATNNNNSSSNGQEHDNDNTVTSSQATDDVCLIRHMYMITIS
jgi:hypothetical protein